MKKYLTLTIILLFIYCGQTNDNIDNKGKENNIDATRTTGEKLEKLSFPGSKHRVIRLLIDDDTLLAEVVNKYEDMKLGLMHRKHLPEDAGMLFVYQSDQWLSFWMKNTYIPLSIAFINSKGTIVDIQKMEPQTTNSHRSKKAAKYGLEVNQGWFEEHDVKVGDRVIF